MQSQDVSDVHLGWVLANDLRDANNAIVLGKGTILDPVALDALASAVGGEAHLIEPGSDEMHENAAGLQVAGLLAGDGIGVVGPVTSRCDLVASGAGVVRVDEDLLRSINAVEDVTVYTVVDWQPVRPDTVVASVKITPFVVRASHIAEVERIYSQAERPLITLKPFLPKAVGVVVVDRLSPEQQRQFQTAIERKVGWFGAMLVDVRFVAPETGRVAAAMQNVMQAGADIVLAAGGNPLDPLDPVLQALPIVNASIVQHGAPMRGSMCWLAQTGAVSILNLASSRMYLGNTIGDVILPMLMTGHHVKRSDIVTLGYGGIPGSAVSHRFPPYDDSNAGFV